MTDKATEIAAQIWCKPETSMIQMDERLAKAFADELRPHLDRLSRMAKALESPELMEILADVEHQRWSRWHKHAEKNRTPENVERWNKLAETDYAELSEHSKNSDREEVRRTLAVIREALKEQEKV